VLSVYVCGYRLRQSERGCGELGSRRQTKGGIEGEDGQVEMDDQGGGENGEETMVHKARQWASVEV
jgi:hypothetical protein